MVLVDKLFGRLSSFSFQLKCSSIIFKFDLPLSVRKEPLITGSAILLISQSIDSTQLKFKGCLPPIGNNKQCCLSIKYFILLVNVALGISCERSSSTARTLSTLFPRLFNISKKRRGAFWEKGD